ncbi:hypothetical protein E0Z10_g11002 [Xylaria hypoxylon]|uniref:Uncharacterized protein n=1 Tax=Xylaria hypoxylon TaxID=37992 RepID=A0A4Z0XV87_9PEZI|nr:hypothetical protein E0Z10_g11002 [Xylaria hypoxylon]
MDANALTFSDNTFTLSSIQPSPPDSLKAGGKAVFNSWKYVPNREPMQAAAKATRPEGTPLSRAGLDMWSQVDLLQSVIENDGFEKDKVGIETSGISVTTSEMDRYDNMLELHRRHSTVGWLRSDE